jgi:DNA polymerase theta
MMYASFQKEDQMNGKMDFQQNKFETNVEIDSQEYRAFADLNKSQIEKLRYIRFYTTMILKDMLMDQPLEAIATYYGVNLGALQSFQTKCAIFSSVVVNLCQHLSWWNLYNLLSQYMDRINFII